MRTASLIFLFAACSVFLSCKKKDTTGSTAYTPECSGTTPTYAVNVSPLISSYCATSGCHASGNTNGPGALTTYAQVKNSVASIRASVVSGSMPEKTTLTAAQKNTIVCWIDAGAANN